MTLETRYRGLPFEEVRRRVHREAITRVQIALPRGVEIERPATPGEPPEGANILLRQREAICAKCDMFHGICFEVFGRLRAFRLPSEASFGPPRSLFLSLTADRPVNGKAVILRTMGQEMIETTRMANAGANP